MSTINEWLGVGIAYGVIILAMLGCFAHEGISRWRKRNRYANLKRIIGRHRRRV